MRKVKTMLRKMVNVIAPNRFRFVKYCDEHGLTPGVTARMIARADGLFGVRGPIGFAEGYHRMPDYTEIEKGIRAKLLVGDVVVPDWWLSRAGGGE